jgi:hypothetical protein
MKKPLLIILCTLFIFVGLGSRIYSYFLSVTNYPLTTDWSESGRIFEAASIYSPIIFGKTLPWPWLDPGRAILEGLVFLIPNGQIWLYRFWLVILSLLTSLITAILINRCAMRNSPLKQQHNRVSLVFSVLWGTLFILQFPIYYHLLLGTIIVLLFLDLDRPFLVLLAVIISSAWEGLCRVNWFFMPAFLAITMYLLSTPMRYKKVVQYLYWPFLWFTSGAIASLLTYGLFIKISHYEIPFLNPNMQYGFFIFKLWPNQAFNLGLIPGIILLSLPLLVVIVVVWIRKIRSLHWIRSLALLSILGIFFIGSTIVSLRAGGGFDLHNYDSFGLILFVIGCYCIMGAVGFDKVEPVAPLPLLNNRFALLGLLIVPIFYALYSIPPRNGLTEQKANQAIQEVQLFTLETDVSRSPILLIDYRHLLVYKMISPVEFYLPYEKIDLMEMAMANNRPYLDQFWEDIEEQRFPLIISEELQLGKQDVELPFGNENNIWVVNVSEPILKYYQLVYSDAGLAIYTPKTITP